MNDNAMIPSSYTIPPADIDIDNIDYHKMKIKAVESFEPVFNFFAYTLNNRIIRMEPNAARLTTGMGPIDIHKKEPFCVLNTHHARAVTWFNKTLPSLIESSFAELDPMRENVLSRENFPAFIRKLTRSFEIDVLERT
jgi:hypothetical protein